MVGRVDPLGPGRNLEAAAGDGRVANGSEYDQLAGGTPTWC